MQKKNFSKILKKKNSKATFPQFGNYALQATEIGILTAKQLEAARRVISRGTKRSCRVWRRAIAQAKLTAKPREIRMGKGKGAINQTVCFVTPGDILFELSYIVQNIGKTVLGNAAKKLPIGCRIIYRTSR